MEPVGGGDSIYEAIHRRKFRQRLKERRLVAGDFVKPGESFHNHPPPRFKHPLGEPEDPVTRSMRLLLKKEKEDEEKERRRQLLIRQTKGNSMQALDATLFGEEERKLEAECDELKSKLSELANRLEQTHFKDSTALYRAGEVRKKLFDAQKKLKMADLERSPEEKHKRRAAVESRDEATKSSKQKYVDGHYTSQYNMSFVHQPPSVASGPLAFKAFPNMSTDVTRWTGNVLNKYWLYEAQTASRQGFLRFTGEKVWEEIPGLGASM